MFKIGDFAKFSRVSVRMLRHYDKLDLLKPASVDPYTDYRYYTADQLPRLNRILALQDLGFRLEQIGELLDKPVSAEEMRGMLEMRREELQAQLEEGLARLKQVQTRIDQVEQEETELVFDIVLRAIPAQRVAAISSGLGGSISELFDEVENYAAEHGLRAPLPPLSLIDTENEEAADLLMVPVQGRLPANERVQVLELPAVEEMACLVFHGDYEQLHLAGSALMTWISSNHYEVAGPLREVYLRFGASQQGYELLEAYLAPEASQFVTELQVPVTPNQGEDYGLLFGQSEADRRSSAGTV